MLHNRDNAKSPSVPLYERGKESGAPEARTQRESPSIPLYKRGMKDRPIKDTCIPWPDSTNPHAASI
ncbi:MAG: hypothetical protein AMXMBFR72_11030 [Betaproteobacteria bacterium]|nr:MAG: hypothetical protein BroJett031_18340 [Betaproteobacteria bacterium]